MASDVRAVESRIGLNRVGRRLLDPASDAPNVSGLRIDLLQAFDFGFGDLLRWNDFFDGDLLLIESSGQSSIRMMAKTWRVVLRMDDNAVSGECYT